ncbi:MAG: aspartate aminotransferase family protein [Desulfurococcales archaeon]|nr:aspartate aminotransferase family protein [Desulfurococcales archaeon]
MEIKPLLFSEEEIRNILSSITEEEIEEGKRISLSSLEDLVFVRGEPGGAVVYDIDGRPYIDMTAQAWTLNVGYSHPDVVYAAALQAKVLNHVRYGFPTIPRLKLMKKLKEIFGFERVALNTQGGGWSLETAMKLAMVNKPGAELFMVSWRGYHGNSLVMTAASHPLPVLIRFKPFGLERFVRFPYPYCYRCPFHRKYPECGAGLCLEFVEKTIRYCTWGNIAGIIIEPIQGPGGHVPAPREFLKGLREIADKYGIYLIFDEAQTAFGRVGAWSASQLYGVKPDMMTLTKGLGGGFPVGAVLAREGIKGLSYPEEHTTFGGNPVPYAAALINIMVIEKLGLVERARELGEYATKRLRDMMERIELIGDVRGPGLYIGVDLVKDRETKEPATEEAEEVVGRALEKGVIFALDMPDIYGEEFTMRNVVKLKPPLVIKKEELDKALDVLEESLIEVSREYGYSYSKA